MIKLKQTFLLSTMMALLLMTVSSANSGDLVLVVNKSLKGISSLSAKEVKRIYLGKSTTLNGKKVKPVALSKGKPSTDIFNASVLGMSADELEGYWIKESLKGGARPPKTVKSSGSLILFVSFKKNAIGYLSPDAAEKSGLTIVKLD